ncbi:MAG: hypothetical protein KF886_03355 [Candidatus Hydrogenedentes bacterium]|nr:hypothetical protein [Candidatus Hydrogenedentota bacterium]
MAVSTAASPAFSASPEAPLWTPAADEVYLQESAEKIFTDAPVTALALHEDVLYAVAADALHTLRAGSLATVLNAPKPVRGVWGLGDRLFVAADDGLHELRGNQWVRLGDVRAVDATLHLGNIHFASADAIYRLEENTLVDIKPDTGYLSTDATLIMEDGTQVISDPIQIGTIQRIASYSGTLYVLRKGELALLDGPVFWRNPIDWGTLPSSETRDMLSFGSRLFVTTDRGLAVLRGMAMTVLTGEDGLPSNNTTCAAPGFAKDLWIGTTTGAIRHVDGEFQYFGADHWLPGDHVNDIVAGDHVVCIATNAGLGIIRYEPYTMLKKADYYERQLDEWGFKRLGFVQRLYYAGKDLGWLREVSDNDGGHTAHYLAAMSYKYAVTGDKAARDAAVDAAEAMMWLEQITPKEGFFARAIWVEGVDEGQRAERGSGGLPAKWYATEDGKWSWKGDTSSDEVNAHYYAVALFHDLAAKGAEKERAKAHLARITNHIIGEGWLLRDMDGKPTRWGRWDPDYLLRPYGYYARGLNGMEAQAYAITAHALTGDPAYEAGLQQLLDWNYHKYTVREKLTFPPDYIVPWDDELAFRCFDPLLRYTKDEYLRSIYLRAIERHWEVMRMQKVPYFNFMYGGLTGNDCEVDQGVAHLRSWPLDPVSHSYKNSHRDDLHTEDGYVSYAKGTRGLLPRETQAAWGSRSAIRYDSSGGGRGAYPAVGWLEDYWMGRYYGMILPPEVKDRDLVSVPDDFGHPKGARPYDGPPRPEIIPGR